MADMLVGGKIDLPRRGRSSGIELAAREVATWTLFPKKLEDNEAEVDRLSIKYRRNKPKLEAAARRRLDSGEAAASLDHFTGLGRGMPCSRVAYHDSMMARRIGDLLARDLGEMLRAIDPDALRGWHNTRDLAKMLELQGSALVALATLLRVTGKNLAG